MVVYNNHADRGGTKIYTKIENIKFDPAADITGTSLEINQFSFSIYGDDFEIECGDGLTLQNEHGDGITTPIIWANYIVTDVTRQNEYSHDVTASSVIYFLDRITLPAVVVGIDGRNSQWSTAGAAIAEIFNKIPFAVYTVDSSISAASILGYFPEQNARERLQWICFAAGAYVSTAFCTENARILPLPDTFPNDDAILIPESKTYYRPSVSYDSDVTSIRVMAHEYTPDTKTSSGEYVSDNEETYYRHEEQLFTIRNTAAASTSAENVVDVSDVTIVNQYNASEIISRLSRIYSKRATVDFEAIDGGEYQPGDKLMVYLDMKGNLMSGYASSCSFSFGHAQKAQITLKQADSATGVSLAVSRVWQGNEIWNDFYYFPAGYSYSLENRYIDNYYNLQRRVFFPYNDTLEGIKSAEPETINVEYGLALLNVGDVLIIYAADSLTEEEYEANIDDGSGGTVTETRKEIILA